MTYRAHFAERPSRQDEVGRDLILRRTRAAMRDWPKTDLSRRVIAQHAGVTPALISYYFADRLSLFEAAAAPVIADYADDVRRIINASGPSSEKFRAIIHLYLALHYRNGGLLESYVVFAKTRDGMAGLSLLSEVKAEAVAFVGVLLDEQCILGECADTVQSIMWGMCKQVAHKAGLASSPASTVEDRILAETDLLYDFFMKGVAIVFPADPMLHAS